MRLIILAAGQGFKFDGCNKLLIRDPKTKETIIEKCIRLFPNYKISVVVGYNALEIMHRYPELDYIYNEQWRITGNSYSLSLALNEEPCVIISSDLLFNEDFVKLIDDSSDNSVFILHSENKGVNTVRCKVEDNIVKSMYMGEGFTNDPETIGVFKISNPEILREWKKRCLANKNVFAGLNLPIENKQITAVDKRDIFLHEINTPLDYLNLIRKIKQ